MAAICYKVSGHTGLGGTGETNQAKINIDPLCPLLTKVGSIKWGVTGVREKSQTRPKEKKTKVKRDGKRERIHPVQGYSF